MDLAFCGCDRAPGAIPRSAECADIDDDGEGDVAVDPANQTRVQACAIVINATVAGTVYTEVAGTAATSTLLTAVGTSPGARAAKAKAYNASNVGSGTATSKPMVLEASKPFVLDLRAVRLSGPGTTKNVTIVIALGSSGDVATSIYWAEDDQCYN